MGTFLTQMHRDNKLQPFRGDAEGVKGGEGGPNGKEWKDYLPLK